MDENNVVTTTTDAAADVEQTETVKTEPAKVEKPDNAEVEKLKAALSRANSQAADYKRQLREKQDATERAEAERAEQEQAMREELEALRKEKDTGDSINRALALKVEDETARKLAKAWQDRDKTALFDSIGEIIQETTTRLSNELLNKQPALSTGIPPTTNTAVKSEEDKIRQWMGIPIKS